MHGETYVANNPNVDTVVLDDETMRKLDAIGHPDLPYAQTFEEAEDMVLKQPNTIVIFLMFVCRIVF